MLYQRCVCHVTTGGGVRGGQRGAAAGQGAPDPVVPAVAAQRQRAAAGAALAGAALRQVGAALAVLPPPLSSYLALLVLFKPWRRQAE